MTRRMLYAAAIAAVAAALGAGTAGAVTPLNGGNAGGTTVTINNGPGDQTDPHVSGDLIAYTDAAPGGRIHYYDFGTSVDLTVPAPAGAIDALSDVSGSRIAFVRASLGVQDHRCVRRAERDAGRDRSAGRLRPLLHRDRRHHGRLSGRPAGNGDIEVADVAAPTAAFQNLSASPEYDGQPEVAPQGDLVVWERGRCRLLHATSTGRRGPAAPGDRRCP